MDRNPFRGYLVLKVIPGKSPYGMMSYVSANPRGSSLYSYMIYFCCKVPSILVLWSYIYIWVLGPSGIIAACGYGSNAGRVALA